MSFAYIEIEMHARHRRLANMLAIVEDPHGSTTSEPTPTLVNAGVSALSLTRNGAVQLDDLLLVRYPACLLQSGSSAIYLGLDPNVRTFISRLVGSAPTPEGVRAVKAMAAIKTFEFTSSDMCAAQANKWPQHALAAIGTYIVGQTRRGLLAGNVTAVVAIMWPDLCGSNAVFPGGTFPKDEWCCEKHWLIASSDLPALTPPDTQRTIRKSPTGPFGF